MKLLGSLTDFVKLIFKKSGFNVTVEPSAASADTTFQLPTADGTNGEIVVNNASGQTLTGKTISGDNNTLSNIGITSLKTELTDADKPIVRDAAGAVVSALIVDTNVDAAADIDRAKLAPGTADHVLINDGSGEFSSEAQLAKSRGGTGADNSSVTFPASGTIVTEDAIQTLVNKEVSSTADMTGALQLPAGDISERPTGVAGLIRYNDQDDVFEGYNELTGWSSIGGGNTVDRIEQAGHGFAVGDVLYLNGATYAKAIATAANTAEVVGVVSRFIGVDTFEITLSGEVEGLSGLTPGEAYFLSDTTAGAISATEPSVVGYISLPVGVASSTTSLYVAPKRGVVVGASNALTQIPLSNNTTNTVQDVSDYNAGELSGWVEIDATVPYKFYINAQFSENGAGTDFNVSYQTSGDAPPAGFSIAVTSAGILQAVMPNIAGFVSASINYGLNVAAVGASLPLSISARNVIGDTSGTEVPAGYVGERIASNAITITAAASATISTVTGLSISLTPGIWSITLNGSFFAGSSPTANGSGLLGFSTDSGANTFSDRSDFVNTALFEPSAPAQAANGSVTDVVNLTSNTTYYGKYRISYSGTAPTMTVKLIAVRIA